MENLKPDRFTDDSPIDEVTNIGGDLSTPIDQGKVDPIKQGVVSRTDKKSTPMKKGSVTSDGVSETDCVKSADPIQSTESGLDTIKSDKSIESLESELDKMASDKSSELIDSELNSIKSGTTDLKSESNLDYIKEGDVDEKVSITSLINDNTERDLNPAATNIRADHGLDSDLISDLDSVISNKQEIVTEHDLDLIADQDSGVSTFSEVSLIKDGTSLESTESEMLTITDKGKITEDTLDELRPDANITEDPIDEVTLMKSATQEVLTESEVALISDSVTDPIEDSEVDLIAESRLINELEAKLESIKDSELELMTESALDQLISDDRELLTEQGVGLMTDDSNKDQDTEHATDLISDDKSNGFLDRGTDLIAVNTIENKSIQETDLIIQRDVEEIVAIHELDELRPDHLTTDDPIDEVTLMKGSTTELSEESETDLIRLDEVEEVESETDLIVKTKRDSSTESEVKVIKNLTEDSLYSDSEIDKVNSPSNGRIKGQNPGWSQVPYVSNVIGLTNRAVNDLTKDLNSLLLDKRYQVYLGTQALGKVMMDKIHGSKYQSLSPSQILNYLNRLSSVTTASNVIEETASMVGGMISGEGMKFNIGPIPNPKFRDVVLDHPLSNVEDKTAAFELLNRGKELDRVRFEMNGPSNAKSGYTIEERSGFPEGYTKSDGTKESLDKFYSEYRKVVFTEDSYDRKSISDKVISYWDDDGNTYTAPLQGYKSLAGFSLDSGHLWDISLKPYEGDSNGNLTYLPPTPTNNSWVPAISYEFTDFKNSNKEVDLGMAYDSISIPEGRKRGTEFGTIFVDDQFGNWFKYFREVSKLTSSVKGGLVLPYKNVTFELCLYILDPGAHIRYLRRLLVVLNDFSAKHSGEEDPSLVTFNMDWSIVGELQVEDD